jgi:ribosomal protein L7/L12
MILNLNSKERDIVVRALANLADEYDVISESAVSEFIRRGFRNDSTDASNLAGRAAGLEEVPSAEEFLAETRRFKRAGQIINAIKYVRATRGRGLKESKDYIDQIGEYDG